MSNARVTTPPGARSLPDVELDLRLRVKEWAAVHAALTSFFESFDVEEEGTEGVGVMADAYRKAHRALLAAGVKIGNVPARARAVLEAPSPS